MLAVPPTIVLLIVTFCVIIIVSFTILAVALTKSKSQSDYTQDLRIYEEQFSPRRSSFTFLFNPRSGGYNLARWGYNSPPQPPAYRAGSNFNATSPVPNPSITSSPAVPSPLMSEKTPATPSRSWFFGGRKPSGLSTSESVTTIEISPSHPTIFGGEKGVEGGSLKVMLTPPTPAKERVFKAVLNHRRESL